MHPEQDHIAVLDSRKVPIRIVLILAVIFAILFGWFSIRWQFANMLAELTLPTDPKAKDVAAFALDLSPGDPATNWFSASATLRPEDAESSLANYENTVRLAPYDFRWWIELGRAYEQAGREQDAEKALLHAVELAPNYTFPHWQLGNFYLRQNRDTEAFAELKKAADNNVVYREQVFSIAWDFYEKDTAKIEELAGNMASVKASLAKFYAVKERPEDSLRAWNSLSDEEKQQQQEIAKLVAQAFYDKRFYRSSVQFVRQLGIEPDAKIGAIENPGFENSLNNESGRVYFGWKTLPLDKVEVKTDPNKKHEGTRSLRILFTGFAGIEVSNIYQIVAIESPARYRLSFWVQTEKLTSAGPPTLEILNANDDKILAAGKPFAVGTNDWQQVQIEFDAPENAEAVNIRTARAYCGNACTIFGTIWLDDFNLEKIN
jgi:hypothetical protein